MFYTCVDQANLAVIEQFGKFNRIAQPGACCQMPSLCLLCSFCCSCPNHPMIWLHSEWRPIRLLAGFNCVCCCLGYAVRGKVSLRVQQLDVLCDTKTKDNVFVQLQVPHCTAF
jgi:hypothetical protein